jgi:hypothetical protein
MIIVPWPFSFPPKALKDIFEQHGYFLPCDYNINKRVYKMQTIVS